MQFNLEELGEYYFWSEPKLIHNKVKLEGERLSFDEN